MDSRVKTRRDLHSARFAASGQAKQKSEQKKGRKEGRRIEPFIRAGGRALASISGLNEGRVQEDTETGRDEALVIVSNSTWPFIAPSLLLRETFNRRTLRTRVQSLALYIGTLLGILSFVRQVILIFLSLFSLFYLRRIDGSTSLGSFRFRCNKFWILYAYILDTLYLLGNNKFRERKEFFMRLAV